MIYFLWVDSAKCVFMHTIKQFYSVKSALEIVKNNMFKTDIWLDQKLLTLQKKFY